MSSAAAIFIKQLQDIFKNSGVLVQFIIFPFMAFIMTRFDIPGMSDDDFIIMFARMLIGMTLISTTATAIAEDREKKSLRFLMMAGVKSHEYLWGIGGVFLTCALVINSLFAIMMPNLSISQTLMMLASMMLGTVASILFGASLGMVSKNEQTAVSLGTAAGMFMGFGPMIATMSGNDTIENVFGIFYTMNFIYDNFRTTDVVKHITAILGNVTVLALVFAWVYGKQESSRKGGNIMNNKKIITAMLAIFVLGGAGVGFAIWHGAGNLTTDNARVTTPLIAITSNIPGRLERFTITEGQYVSKNEVIGWVENAEAMRSPVDGLVIQTNAVLNQAISSTEPVAIIADINNIHIQANIEETDILNVQLEQQVFVTIDGFGNRKFEGYITNIGSITQSELAGSGSVNDNGSFTRRTHLIPVEIYILDDVKLDNLIGANASVRILLK